MIQKIKDYIVLLKQFSIAAGALLVGWFLLVFQLRGKKIAKLEAKELVSEETAKQKELDDAVKKAKEEYEAAD